MKSEKDRWITDVVFEKSNGVEFPPSYPNEMLVKICSSKHYSDLTSRLFSDNIKVCEIGCFSGNNLRLFLEKGYKVSGVEINLDMLNLGRNNLKRLGYPIEKVDLREGDNLNIPFENDCFDLFVSINAIHYNFGKDFERGIAEYRRVVKEGGVVIIETSAKKHDCVRAANRVNELDYIWNAGDFRDGQHFGFVDNEKQFEDILKKYFSEVEIHHRHEITPKSHLEWYIGVCRA